MCSGDSDANQSSSNTPRGFVFISEKVIVPVDETFSIPKTRQKSICLSPNMPFARFAQKSVSFVERDLLETQVSTQHFNAHPVNTVSLTFFFHAEQRKIGIAHLDPRAHLIFRKVRDSLVRGHV